MTVQSTVFCNLSNPDTPTGGSLYDRRFTATLPVTAIYTPSSIPQGFRGIFRIFADYLRDVSGLRSCDILMVNSGKGIYLLPIIFLRRLNGVSTVSITHLPVRFFRKCLVGRVVALAEETLLRLVDRAVAPSQFTLDFLKKIRGDSNCILIPIPRPEIDGLNAPDISYPNPRPTESSYNILFAGNIEKRKGLHLLIEALILLPDNIKAKTKLDIVGKVRDTKYVRKIRKRANACGIRVVWHGYLTPDSGKWDIFRRADILAQPSMSENYGITLCEAKMFGLPAVIFSGCGMDEVTTDGFDSLKARPNDISGYASNLHRLLCDPALRKKIGENARKSFFSLPQNDDFIKGVNNFKEAIGL